jgi:cell division protein FtsL
MAPTTLSPRTRRAHTTTSGHTAVTAVARNSIAPPESRVQPDSPDLEQQRRELHVVRTAPKRTGLLRRRLVLVAPALVIVSLLGVAGAQAVLTEGQVRLNTLQSKVSAAQTRRFDLELQVAQEEQPSAVVAAARAHGMTVPSVVNDIPEVNPEPSITTKPQTHASVSSTKTAKRNTTPDSASGHP